MSAGSISWHKWRESLNIQKGFPTLQISSSWVTNLRIASSCLDCVTYKRECGRDLCNLSQFSEWRTSDVKRYIYLFNTLLSFLGFLSFFELRQEGIILSLQFRFKCFLHLRKFSFQDHLNLGFSFIFLPLFFTFFHFLWRIN